LIIFKFIFLGFLTALLFPPFFILPLGFFIFPYLYKQINKLNSIKEYFYTGFLYGLGFTSLYLIWIRNPFLTDETTKIYATLSILLIFVISLIFGIFFISFNFTKKLNNQIFLFPLVFVILEIFIANIWYGFPWLSFGLIYSNNILGSILLFSFGSNFTSYIIILLFLFPYIVYQRKKIVFFNLSLIITLSLLSIAFFAFFNFNKINDYQLNTDLFQMNYKIKDNKENKYDELVTLIQESNADLMIFAENNYPFVVKNLEDIKLGNFLTDNQTIVIGATRLEENNYFNSILVIEKNKIDFFDKKILVPFGEFMPLRNYLDFINVIVGTFDFQKGNKDRQLIINNNYQFIPVICYEIIFFWKLLNDTNNQSNLLINITNDAWFGKYLGPYQHFYLTKMRAAEYRKSLVRVSNNGISAIIDHKGNILTFSNLFRKEKINFNLKVQKSYNLIFFHKIFTYLILFSFVSIFILSRIKK
tara:strand:- start:4316 stop:5737 length:1422 start_codon:yes stop_codon:yes gene_type:complete